ncbi:hypothetical protein [Rhodococcoides corynebacterioides]
MLCKAIRSNQSVPQWICTKEAPLS